MEKKYSGVRDFRGRDGNAGFEHPTPPPFPDPVLSAGSIYKIPFHKKKKKKKKCAFGTCTFTFIARCEKDWRIKKEPQ